MAKIRVKDIEYGDTLVAMYEGKRFTGIADYDDYVHCRNVIYSDGVYIKPTDGTTFLHNRFREHGNCWVNRENIISHIKKIKKPILDESLFEL